MHVPQARLDGARLSLNWGYLQAIARGQSAIDLRGMALRDGEDARRFASEYGFDLDDPLHRSWIRRVHREALDFIRSQLLDSASCDLIPSEIANPVDEVDLLVHASRYSKSRSTRRLWSCAVLKVMHALFYIDNNIKLRHFDAIRQQVFESFEQVVLRDGEAAFLSDGEICLPLLHYEKKSNKSRHSILLKLLQKPSYVAEDIHDHLGVRMVFETRTECLLALRVLQRAQLLSAINIESHRVRNNLIDLDVAREVFAHHRQQMEQSQGYPLELLKRMDAQLIERSEAAERQDNPHSSSGYRSVQLTVRRMIHLPDAGLSMDADWVDREGGADRRRHGEMSFYFNYEIQMMDRQSYQASTSGPASHGAYKQRQIATARKRVLGAELEYWVARQVQASPSDSGT
ncbi:TIGR04552 family protein [Pseudomarimonas arenosa]|uniref:TIGR04552 family protein n=1 Tax=Pseudomarimonas arenosa TaxID=2774145 RepID=A0AAW3ZJJ6_9GAMM|nr:TIGR04552 family protein [Pseudomarimonas arenosa]MBD8525938.1 TIGR04552 family protein [Pseudomarimonas arenosa]